MQQFRSIGARTKLWFGVALILWTSEALSEEPLKVGIILAQSRELAVWAKACENGAGLALDSTSPEIRPKLKVLFEDDAGVPTNTITAFNKLLDHDHASVIVTWSSSTSKSVAPLADQRKVPLIAIASDPKVAEGHDHVVNLWVTPEEEARLLLEEAVRRKYATIARITALQDGPISINKAFDGSNGGKVKVGLDEEYDDEAKDFRPYLIRLKAQKGIDAIFVNLWGGQVGLFAKQARELGIKVPLIGAEFFEDEAQVKISGGALVGQWYVQAGEPSGEFTKAYAARFPGASMVTGANCHDAVLLVADAIAKGKSGDLNGYLHTVHDFRGALGTFSATGDNRFSLPAVIKVVTEHGFVPVKSGS